MTRGNRIVAIDAGIEQSALAEPLAEPDAKAPAELEQDWADEEPAPHRNWGAIFATSLAMSAVAGWTVLFALANQAELQSGGSLAQWTGWIRDWSVPILLVGVAWLIMMRNSRREAQRFGQTARLLSEESTRLETRLTTVNGELSLAREFISAQARDLEALGRIASERLSENAASLAGLIRDNGMRIDAIGDVSSAALENMEKLRGQLPVIASSAKDVTNNIGAAGRTARVQLEDMITGFNKLNDFGQASERQVQSLRNLVGETLTEFTRQADQLEAIATERFAALNAQGEEFRARLENDEVEALAAVRSRSKAMGEELNAARAVLDSHEAESLTSLRARLTSVRDESANIARSLRDGEAAAIDSWRGAIDRLEQQLREAIAKVGEVDENAMESARRRLAELAREAEEVDARIAERDQHFEQELGRRRAEIEASHAAFGERLGEQMAQLDAAIVARHAAQLQHNERVEQHSAALSTRLAEIAEQVAEAARHGEAVESQVGEALARLAEKLTLSRSALAGTDSAVNTLTDHSVRLLELIQASVQHSRDDLPQAMASGEAKLREIEERAAALAERLALAEGDGAKLAGHVVTSHAQLVAAATELDALHTRIGTSSKDHAAELASLRQTLATLRDESEALAIRAQAELGAAIAALGEAAKGEVANIEMASAASVSALAARLSEESAAAIDRAMRSRTAEVAGELEQAAAHAAGVSREAAVQLRDQLGKVNELAGNLERRVAHARSRAEEQVDNDFARRVALITESLNSNAIDIARAMDVDVTDAAWASYLRGDRGVFTRRAVKLLEAPEAKAVAQLYESDRDFREHVSRYIHDFEAMLRQLLSTRDGHALGVTLLSSDMGKLYVALAQAIARLRN